MTKTSTRGGLLTRALSCGCAVALAASLAPAAGVAWAATPTVNDPTNITVNVGTVDANGAYTPFATKKVNLASLSYGNNAVLYHSGSSWGVVATNRYVTLDTILEGASLDQYWTSDAKLAYAVSGATVSSSDFTSYAKYEGMNFYGDTQKDTNSNEVENPSGTKVEPGLAFYAYSAVIGSSAVSSASTAAKASDVMHKKIENDSMSGTPINVVTYMNGLTETDYKSGANWNLTDVASTTAIESVNILVGDPTSATRIYGQEWADTMVGAVDATFSSKVNTATDIVLTSADSYQDALSASGLAGALECPIIMTSGESLTKQTADLIQKYAPKNLSTGLLSSKLNVYVIGGEVVVKPAVVNAIKELPAFYGQQTNLNITRIFGDEAWDTSLEIRKAMKGEKYITSPNAGTGVNDIVIACSGGYQDAMSIAPYAYKTGTPIILTDNRNMLSDDVVKVLTEDTTYKLQSTSIVNVVGGPAVVAAGAEAQLSAVTSQVFRTYGQSAYDTSNLIATYLYGNNKRFTHAGSAFKDQPIACFATGENYLDALASAAYCATNNSVLLLVSNSDSTTIDEFLTLNAKVNSAKNPKVGIATAKIFGGEGILGKAVQMDINQALTKAAK